MSCFQGQMKEYRDIAIDRFVGKNLQCSAFFLSHCHKDHMVGLENQAFLDHIMSRKDIFLYCSEITYLLLTADEEYKSLDKYIHVLEVGIPHQIMIFSNSKQIQYSVSVTLISAGHCPGSVMFMFEGREGTCLYTGDFRWEVGQAQKIAAFKNNDSIKEIKSMYVDTTFCVPEAYHIPSRNECVEATVILASDWLHSSPLHAVFVSCPARYGHEHFMMELARRLDAKVHVPAWKVKLYDQISDLHGIFTSDPCKARIHACSMKTKPPPSCLTSSVSSGILKHRFMSIRPSTMWFTSGKTKSSPEDLIVTPVSSHGLHRVCYSMHSSYSEICDLVRYLQPKKAFPNVRPMSDATLDIVQSRLDGFLSYPNHRKMKLCLSDETWCPLGVLKAPSAVQCSKPGSVTSSEDLNFSSHETSSEDQIHIIHDQFSVAEAQENSGPKEVKNSLAGERSSSSHRVSLVHSNEWNFSDEKLENDTKEEESLHLYVSGDSDVSDEENSNIIQVHEMVVSTNNESNLVASDVSQTSTKNMEGNLSDEKLENDAKEEESLHLYVSGDSDVSDEENSNITQVHEMVVSTNNESNLVASDVSQTSTKNMEGNFSDEKLKNDAKEEESLHLYVSGDSDVSDEENSSITQVREMVVSTNNESNLVASDVSQTSTKNMEGNFSDEKLENDAKEESLHLYVSGNSDVSDEENSSITQGREMVVSTNNESNLVASDVSQTSTKNMEGNFSDEKLENDAKEESLHLYVSGNSDVSDEENSSITQGREMVVSTNNESNLVASDVSQISTKNTEVRIGGEVDDDDDDSEIIPSSQGTPTKVLLQRDKQLHQMTRIKMKKKELQTDHVHADLCSSFTSSGDRKIQASPKNTSAGKILAVSPGEMKDKNYELIPVLSSSEESPSSQSLDSQTLWHNNCTLSNLTDVTAVNIKIQPTLAVSESGEFFNKGCSCSQNAETGVAKECAGIATCETHPYQQQISPFRSEQIIKRSSDSNCEDAPLKRRKTEEKSHFNALKFSVCDLQKHEFLGNANIYSQVSNQIRTEMEPTHIKQRLMMHETPPVCWPELGEQTRPVISFQDIFKPNNLNFHQLEVLDLTLDDEHETIIDLTSESQTSSL